MLKSLERRTGELALSKGDSIEREYGISNDVSPQYSTFAELYLEKPINLQSGTTCSVCTWRGIPTIDDW